MPKSDMYYDQNKGLRERESDNMCICVKEKNNSRNSFWNGSGARERQKRNCTHNGKISSLSQYVLRAVKIL